MREEQAPQTSVQRRQYVGREALVRLPDRGGFGVERSGNDDHALDPEVAEGRQAVGHLVRRSADGESVDEVILEPARGRGGAMAVARLVVLCAEPRDPRPGRLREPVRWSALGR